MKTKIRAGDHVFHPEYGLGIVKVLYYSGDVEVDFSGGIHRIDKKKLLKKELYDRQQVMEKKQKLEKFSDERSKLFMTLKSLMADDFPKSDLFYGNCCANFISIEEYQIEKTTFLEELRHKELEKKRLSLSVELKKMIKKDFFKSDSFYQNYCNGFISFLEYENEKILFVQDWVKKNNDTELDVEQAAAIAAVHGHVQVIARAGSGKTTTLVNRAVFLQKHCGIAPNEMLLLAFNRKAAQEIGERLENTLGDCIPHVMTFHALAYAIVHPEESILYNGPLSENQGLSRVFQKVIDDHLQIPEFKVQIRQLMMAHFREDWRRIVSGGYDKSKDEFLQFRRFIPRESLRGEYVKSYGEKIIADFLFEHNVPYRYERNHWWNGINYRPDFTILKTQKSGVIIEYFGLQSDPDYDEMSQAKREYWSQKDNWMLLEFSPRDIGIIKERLKEFLENHGILCNRLSEDEIWDRIRDRAIDRFTAASVNFVGRCRKYWLTPDKLDELIFRHNALSGVEDMFLKVVRQLYEAYLDRLISAGEEDFDGLMQRAVESVSNGTTAFRRKSSDGDIKKLRYIFIDEFQDFSELFYRLIAAIRQKNPSIELFCVGDDWQAINGFAGSDLKFFQCFSDYFGSFQKLNIATNYRSPQLIVSVGNSLMQGLGTPAVAYKKSVGEVFLADLSDFEPSFLEKQRHPGDIITPVVLRLANKEIANGFSIILLSRRNALPWYVNYQEQEDIRNRGLDRYLDFIHTFFPKNMQGKITISTAHKYKGLEKPVVIVLDAVMRSYPLIHPDWIFSRILGDTPERLVAEERRLFYVALTRAIERLIIITDRGFVSPFLQDIKPVQPINWGYYTPPVGIVLLIVIPIFLVNQL